MALNLIQNPAENKDLAYAQIEDGPAVSKYEKPAQVLTEQNARLNAFSILQNKVVSFQTVEKTDAFGENYFERKFTLAPYSKDAQAEWTNSIMQALEVAKGFPKVQQEIAQYLTDAFYCENISGQDERRQARDVLDFKLVLNSVKYLLSQPESEQKYGIYNEPGKNPTLAIHNEPGYTQAPNKTWILEQNGEWATSKKNEDIAIKNGVIGVESNSGVRPIDLSKKPPLTEVVAADDVNLEDELSESPAVTSFQEETIPFEQIQSEARRISATAAKSKDENASFKASEKILRSYFAFDENDMLLGIKPEYKEDEKVMEQCRDILWFAYEATESSPSSRTRLLGVLRRMSSDAYDFDARTGEYANDDEITAGLQHIAAWGIYKYGKHTATVAYHDFSKKNYSQERLKSLEEMFSGISSDDPTFSRDYLSEAKGQIPIFVDLLVNGKYLKKDLGAQEAAINGLSAILWSNNKIDGILAAESLASIEYFSNEMRLAPAKSLLNRAWDEQHLQIVRSACIFYLEKGVLSGSFDDKMNKDLTKLTMLASSNYDLAMSMLVVSSGRSRVLFGVDNVIQSSDSEIFEKYTDVLVGIIQSKSMSLGDMRDIQKNSSGEFIYEKKNEQGELVGTSRIGYATYFINEIYQIADEGLKSMARDSYIKINEAYEVKKGTKKKGVK